MLLLFLLLLLLRPAISPLFPYTTLFRSRAIQATNPDVVFVASYPPDSVGMVRAANEIGLKPKMFGGGMIGLRSEEHTSELQSLRQLVCRLLLEKKYRRSDCVDAPTSLDD